MKKSKINKIVIFTQPAKGGEQSIKTIKMVANMVVETRHALSHNNLKTNTINTITKKIIIGIKKLPIKNPDTVWTIVPTNQRNS